MSTLPLQVGLGAAIEETLGGIVEFVPVVVGVLVVLLIGYIIGRVLGGIVTRLLQGVGLSKYVPASMKAQPGALERSLGKLVSYYVYFIALLAAADILGIAILSDLLANLAEFLPTILGAIVVLVIGFLIGRIVGGIVEDVVGGLGLAGVVQDTPLERFADSEGEFGHIVGMLVEYYIYLITLLAAADILDIPGLSTLLDTFAGYIPALIGGLVILVVGILVAEFVEELVVNAVEGRVGRVAGVAVKVFVYYIVVTLALSAIGFDTAILTNMFTVFVTAFFGTLAVALAIGVGVGVGLGSKDYVADNIGGWVDNARASVAEPDGSDE
jgi:hypothetical protein